MHTIWKYTLSSKDSFSLEIPENAEILSLHMQSGEPCIWVLCDPNLPKVERTFFLYGTGHPITQDMDWLRFVGTFLIEKDLLVFHLFEKLQPVPIS